MQRGLRFNDIAVKRDASGWVVSVPRLDGGALEYVYRTRQKARYMAAVFKLKPTWMPSPTRVSEPSTMGARLPGGAPSHAAAQPA